MPRPSNPQSILDLQCTLHSLRHGIIFSILDANSSKLNSATRQRKVNSDSFQHSIPEILLRQTPFWPLSLIRNILPSDEPNCPRYPWDLPMCRWRQNTKFYRRIPWSLSAGDCLESTASRFEVQPRQWVSSKRKELTMLSTSPLPEEENSRLGEHRSAHLQPTSKPPN
jgi:hypothetical protein